MISNTYDAEKQCWIIKFDGNVTTIGQKAFYDSKSLTSITIPDSVTGIGAQAFYGCTRLTCIYFKAITPPSTFLASTNGYEFFWDAFDNNASGRKIYVPAESVEAYKTSDSIKRC